MYADNPRARFDYEILDTYTAGLVLAGYEVKAIRAGKVSIKGCYVKILGDEAYLVGAQIAPYQPGNVPTSYDEQRTRKLLLKRSELKYLLGKTQEQSLTLVPLKLYDNHGLVKLEIGLGKGKKHHDKREATAQREEKRKISRALKTRLS